MCGKITITLSRRWDFFVHLFLISYVAEFIHKRNLRSEGIASLVNIGRVVDNDYLNVLYIINSKTIHAEGLFFKHERSQ
jgi:hypothetical protein